MNTSMKFQKATFEQLSCIWQIIQQAIALRKSQGSEQWQNGYPNLEVLKKDISMGCGYVLISGNEILAYAAIFSQEEPAYNNITNGNWINQEPYICVYRLAVKQNSVYNGLATHLMQCTEKLAQEFQIKNIRLDTNFDNLAMLRILEKLNYTFCGNVMYANSSRKAFQKVL